MRERYVVDNEGKPIAVLLDIEEYHQLIQRLQQVEALMPAETPTLSEEAWKAHRAQFLSRAKDDVNLPNEALSREKIYDTRDVVD